MHKLKHETTKAMSEVVYNKKPEQHKHKHFSDLLQSHRDIAYDCQNSLSKLEDEGDSKSLQARSIDVHSSFRQNVEKSCQS